MSLVTRPGVYQRPVRPTRRVGGLARRDIPVFIGFTTRGPAMEAVRIESPRQFAGVFGDPFPTSHLYDAVRGYFETGGNVVYVVRLAGADSAVARHDLATAATAWTFTARIRVRDLANLRAGETPMQWQDHLLRNYGQSIPDPGSWGNGLALRVTHNAAFSRESATSAADRRRLYPTGMSGLEDGALLVVSQGTQTLRAVIAEADLLRREIVLDRDLPPGFVLGTQEMVSLSVQTTSVEVLLNGQRAELFSDLSPSPTHRDFLATAINAASRYVLVTPPGAYDPAHVEAGPEGEDAHPFPGTGDYALSGGSDGLKEQTEADWRAALAAQKMIDEIALVAAPDLVRQAPVDREVNSTQLTMPNTCHLAVARPLGSIAARIVDAETEDGLKDVRIEAAGEGAVATSSEDGMFLLEGVAAGLVELRLLKEKYLPANPLVQASADQNAATLDLPLTEIPILRLIARDEVPALSRDDIDTVQRAMCDSLNVGSFRIAVLDPPGSEMPPEDLLNWVAALDRTARGFAAGPWIGLAEDNGDGLRMQPPSGHVCGAFAVAELTQGVHRAPGNVLLRHVKSVPLDVSDAIAGEFHRAALNLVTPTRGRGIRLMGGRTLSSYPDWQHASVRRLFDALERTLLSRLNWAVFENNNSTTRQVLKFAIEQLLEGMRRRGMFAGSTPDAAYSVNCDEDVNPPAGQARGELVAEIAVAPTRPYEFIIFSLSAQADAIEVTERT